MSDVANLQKRIATLEAANQELEKRLAVAVKNWDEAEHRFQEADDLANALLAQQFGEVEEMVRQAKNRPTQRTAQSSM
jgi:chromosome segregation ATPase